MKYRLTAHYVYFDGQHGYEALGHDAYSQRPFIEITRKLALYEDTGCTPEEIGQLRKVVDAARNLPCPIWEHSNPVEDELWDTFITALAELEGGNTNDS